MKMCGGVEE